MVSQLRYQHYVHVYTISPQPGTHINIKTYIPKLLLTGSDVPDTSVNLIKSQPIAPNHSRQNAVNAKADVSRPRHALIFYIMTKRVDWNEKEVEYCYGEEGNAMALCRAIMNQTTTGKLTMCLLGWA